MDLITQELEKSQEECLKLQVKYKEVEIRLGEYTTDNEAGGVPGTEIDHENELAKLIEEKNNFELNNLSLLKSVDDLSLKNEVLTNNLSAHVVSLTNAERINTEFKEEIALLKEEIKTIRCDKETLEEENSRLNIEMEEIALLKEEIKTI